MQVQVCKWLTVWNITIHSRWDWIRVSEWLNDIHLGDRVAYNSDFSSSGYRWRTCCLSSYTIDGYTHGRISVQTTIYHRGDEYLPSPTFACLSSPARVASLLDYRDELIVQCDYISHYLHICRDKKDGSLEIWTCMSNSKGPRGHCLTVPKCRSHENCQHNSSKDPKANCDYINHCIQVCIDEKGGTLEVQTCTSNMNGLQGCCWYQKFPQSSYYY